jgi:peptidoglycan/LPS O-acetylase OafA/YrhL
LKYIQELDGLRAIAVLSVFLYHLDQNTIPGGFLGVDIFFVISGFIITRIIWNDISNKTFSFSKFYIRRIRRIIPALFFMLLIISIICFYIFLPNDLYEYSRSVIYILAFIPNIFYLNNTNYFDLSSELTPLLHTWSLGVEEQFYFVYPLLLFLIFKLRLTSLIRLILLIFILASFILSIIFSFKNNNLTFYLIHFRAWELLAGGLTYFISKNFTKSDDSFLSSVGLLLIIYSFFYYKSDFLFSGFFILLSCIGTSLVILNCENNNFGNLFLRNKYLLKIGVMSYSIYLWHYPIISLKKYTTFVEIDFFNNILIIIITFSLSYFSLKFIEQPFRNKNKIKNLNVFINLSLLLILILLINLYYLHNKGFPENLPKNIVWRSLGEKIDSKGEVCEPIYNDLYKFNICNFGDKTSDKKIILYGDSHARSIHSTLNSKFIDQKIQGIRVEIRGCEIVPSIINVLDRYNNFLCDERFNNFLSFIEKNKASVIVSSRWTFKLFPIKNKIEQMPYKNSSGIVEYENYREYAYKDELNNLRYDADSKENRIRFMIESFLSKAEKLYFVYPIPEIGWDIARLNHIHFKKNGKYLENISIPYSEYINRNEFVINIFEDYKDNIKFFRIKPENELCNSFINNSCTAQFKTVPLYYDDDHLSDEGAKLVLKNIFFNEN